VLFLGTASSFPTKNRNHPALLLRYGSDALLFDCGEGTQRQLRIAKESPMKINKIFISHWHGDHVLGIAGLLQSSTMNRRGKSMEVFGPKGTRDRIKILMKAFGVALSYKLIIHELNLKKIEKIDEGEGYHILAMPVKHSLPTIAYSFEENTKYRIDKSFVKKHKLQGNPILDKLHEGKSITYRGKRFKIKDVTTEVRGKKIAIVMDTSALPSIVELAKEADLFICEGTFSNKLKEKTESHGHMTVKQAARLAKKARVKKLVLTHFSQRYKDVSELSKEAKSVFSNTVMAKDFMEISV
jgi:ribonuclease Z